MYLKVDGPERADIEVSLLVGSATSPNTGRAYLRNASVIAVPGPPPDATATFDLAAVRKELGVETHTPIGSPVSLVLTLGVLAALGGWGWRRFGDKNAAPALSRAVRRSENRNAKKNRTAATPVAVLAPPMAAPAWSTIDTIAIAGLMAFAAAFRFWRLGLPAEIVFDEIHYVQFAKNYLHGEYFMDLHPPLGEIVIAIGIAIFGDHPWSWRIDNALMGTALAGITYLLGRRLAGSRLAAFLAGSIIAVDGMFLVYSRIAVIDITYVTCAAASYLLLFRFAQTSGPASRRKLLFWIGVALGLCAGAKVYIPAATCLLVTGFIAYVMVYRGDGDAAPLAWSSPRVIGAGAIAFSVAAIVYISTYFFEFYWGWWSGMGDLFHYLFVEVPQYEAAFSGLSHPSASPWWSWPLMLRPIAFWRKFPNEGDVRTIWGGGNPLLWWGALSAIAITAVRAFERPNLARWFMVIGYAAYLVVMIPIGRTIFIYHYLPSLYIGFLALGVILADFINEQARPWEHLAIISAMVPACLLGMGVQWGLLACAAIVGGYAYFFCETHRPGRYVATVYLTGAAALFFYFLPVWIGLPMARFGWHGYFTMMWLKTSGTLRNWI